MTRYSSKSTSGGGGIFSVFYIGWFRIQIMVQNVVCTVNRGHFDTDRVRLTFHKTLTNLHVDVSTQEKNGKSKTRDLQLL